MDDLVEELAKPVLQMIRDALDADNDAKIIAIFDLLSFSAFRFVMDKLTKEERILITMRMGKQ